MGFLGTGERGDDLVLNILGRVAILYECVSFFSVGGTFFFCTGTTGSIIVSFVAGCVDFVVGCTVFVLRVSWAITPGFLVFFLSIVIES